MGGQAPTRPVAHCIGPHAVHCVAGTVDDDQPKSGNGEHPFEHVKSDPAGRLRPGDRRRTHLRGARHLPLTDVGDAAGTAYESGDVEEFGHAGSLILGASGPEDPHRICGQRRGLWIKAGADNHSSGCVIVPTRAAMTYPAWERRLGSAPDAHRVSAPARGAET